MENLPKLPRGMGSYDYFNDKIRYRKTVKAGDKSHRVIVYGESINEVNKLMALKEKEIIKKSKLADVKSKTITLEHAMLEWLELYKRPQLKPRTYDVTEGVYRNYIKESSLGRKPLKDITRNDIQKFINDFFSLDYSYSVKRKVFMILAQFFKHHYVQEPNLNPFNSVVKPKNSNEITNEELIVWDDDEMIELSKKAMIPYKYHKSGYRYGLIIAFMMWTFIRVGEMRGLKWEDIDFKNKTVEIKRQMSKSRDRVNGGYKSFIDSPKYGSSRKFVMSNMAYDCIVEYKKRFGGNEGFILKTEYGITDESVLWMNYNKMIKDFPKEKHVTIHGLRHSGISYMLRHGVPVEVVSKMAGHKNIKITLDTYYSVLEKQKIDAMEKFNKENNINLRADG